MSDKPIKFSRESLIDYIVSAREQQLRKNHKSYIDLSNSDLSGLDIRDLDLKRIIFTDANFTGASLSNCNLSDSDLSMAIFKNADLYHATLYGARLIGTDFTGANLCGVNLSFTDIRHADFKDAKITDSTVFVNASIYKPKNMPCIPMACPDSEFIAWKKCYYIRGKDPAPCIVKLLIPEDAKRSSATGRKCRASKAKVLEIQTCDGQKLDNVTAWSGRDISFWYKVGSIVEPVEPFDDNRWKECASGIHFFITRQEAVEY
jgi:uncharacterized protein YjbI with pentapeptide repeats